MTDLLIFLILSYFNGEEILKPDDITEVDTDVSSMLKFNGHAETVQKILDVVKKDCLWNRLYNSRS